MKPGIYTMTAEEYHADPCDAPSLSSSIARLILQDSPLHAKAAHPKLTEQPTKEEAEHFDIGTIAHGLILEGIDKAVVLEEDNYRTKKAQEARDAARKAGKCPILRKHFTAVQEMTVAFRQQLNSHAEGADCFLFGKPEQTLIWREPNGIWCRARLDWLSDNYKRCDDYKSTSASANPEVISRTMWSNGWDTQAAFYLRGIRALAFDIEPVFRFVVQETYRPYALSVLALAPDALALAERKVEAAVQIWGQCLQSGNWPGYPGRIAYAECPGYESARWMEREAGYGAAG